MESSSACLDGNASARWILHSDDSRRHIVHKTPPIGSVSDSAYARLTLMLTRNEGKNTQNRAKLTRQSGAASPSHIPTLDGVFMGHHRSVEHYFSTYTATSCHGYQPCTTPEIPDGPIRLIITHAAHGLYLFTYRSGVEKLTVKPIRLHSHAYLKQVEEEKRIGLNFGKVVGRLFSNPGERMDQSMHNANRGSRHSRDNQIIWTVCAQLIQQTRRHQVVATSRSAADKQQLFRNVDQQAFVNRYVHALLSKNPRIVWRFTDIMNMVPRGSTSEEVIQALIPRAHLSAWLLDSLFRASMQWQCSA